MFLGRLLPLFRPTLLGVYLRRTSRGFVHGRPRRIGIVHRRGHGGHVVVLIVRVVWADACWLRVTVLCIGPGEGSSRDQELGRC